MRPLLLAIALGACWTAPQPAKPIAIIEPPPQSSTAQRKTIPALTPPEVIGAVLGQTLAELQRGRPSIEKDADEEYDFRDHYVERLDSGGIETVHYYTLKSGGAMYQISFDFTEPEAAAGMWQRYITHGHEIKDLGGREIVIDAKPFEVRVWHNENRLQIMAVIEGSEWWSQYHGESSDSDDESDVDDPNDVP